MSLVFFKFAIYAILNCFSFLIVEFFKLLFYSKAEQLP